ncbi:MAG: hypothetical protein NC131_00685 [Roseburia sp.]|nr:hypothetical protein [Roseburia sp.]
MSKLRKTILIIGIIVVAVAASLGTALALYATGSMKTETVELEYVLREKEKVYDGTPLKLDDEINDVSLIKGKLQSGHTAKFDFSGSQTNVGTSSSDASVRIYDNNGFNVTSEYSIKVVGAPLTVTAKSISVDMPSQKVVYNGSKVLFTDYTAEGELVSGHKIYGSTDAALMNVGDTLPADLTPLIFDVAGNDVTANYVIDFHVGEIEVMPRHISVRPVSYEKVYDGTTMYADRIECVEGALVEGQYVKFEINEGYENKITDAGTVETAVTLLKIYDVIGGEEVDVTDNYEIDTYETGMLTVTKRPLTVTAKSAEFVYNGRERSLADVDEVKSIEGLADGEEFLSVTYSGARTDVGTTENIIIDLAIKGDTANYEITRINGIIEIKPYELTIETASAEKYYDGEPLISGSFVNEVILAKDGHEARVGGSGELPSQTDAGVTPNAYTVTVFDGETDCTGNYEISYVYGTLTVKRLPVAATLNALEHVTYDGEPHVPTLGDETGNSQYFDIQPVLGEDEQVEKFTLDYTHFDAVSDARVIRDAGEYRYTVRFKDKSFENNYLLEVPESGYLTVDTKGITVTTGSTAKPYSGKPVTNETLIGSEGLVAGHEFKLPLTYPSVTNAGKIFNEYTVGVKDATGADVTYNYDVNYVYGTLTVTELPLTVTLKNYNNAQAFTYSGKEISFTATDAISDMATTAAGVTVSEVIGKDDFTVITAKKIVDAGTDYTYTVKITDREFAKNFKLTINNGSGGANGNVTVKALAVTVIIKDVERVYNGAKQVIDAYATVHSISNTSTGLTREDFVVDYNDSSLDHINAVNYPFKVSLCDAKKANYDLTVQNLNSASKSTAELKILPYELNITIPSVTFVYNGEAQTSDKYTCGALANSKHKINIATSEDDMPSVCEVKDTVLNSLSFKITDASGIPVTENYDIKPQTGTLSVTPCPVTITTGSGSQVYTGNEFEVRHADPDITLFADHEISIPEDIPVLIDVGSVKNEFSCDIADSHGTSVKDNYLITYIYGTVSVTACKIIVTTADAARVYNGNPLSKTGGITMSGLPEENDINYYAEKKEGAAECTLTDVGTVPNKFDCAIYLSGTGEVTGNFEIEYVYGTLKVTPLTITLALNDFSEYALEYDGTAKTFAVNEAITEIYVNGETFALTDAPVHDDSEWGIAEFADGESDYNLEFRSSDFEIVYSSLIIDAGTYSYSVKFAKDEFARNFVLEQSAPAVHVAKMQVEVFLRDFTGEDKLTFGNDVKTLNIADAVLSVIDKNGEGVDSNLLAAADFTVVYPAEIKAAGDYVYGVKITYDYKAKNFNFDESTFGNVTVDKFKVTIALDSIKTDYSGAEYAIPAGALTFKTDTELLTADDFTLKYDGGATALNAGAYPYSAVITDKTYAANFTVVTDKSDDDKAGVVTIDKLTVNVTLQPLSYTFNGAVQTLDASRAISADSALLKADDFTFTVKHNGAAAEIRDAGAYTYEAALNNTNFKLAGGVTAVLGGAITVARLNVTVTLNNFVKEYDGDEYVLAPETAIYAVSGSIYGIYDFKVEYNDTLPDHADADDYTIKVSLADRHAADSENVNINTLNGKISITRRAVTLTTPTTSFVYNGNAQSATDAVLSGALSGHKAKVGTTWAEITDVGSEPNDSKYIIYYEDGGAEIDVTGNYKITYAYGTLTVTKRPLTFATDGDTKPYDGTPLNKDTYEIAGLVVGHSVKMPAENALPYLTDAGKIKNEYTINIMKGVDDVTGNYAVTYSYGELEVTKADVEVVLKDAAKNYTGADIALSASDVIDSVTVLDESKFAVTFEGAVINAGKYNFEVVFNDEKLAANYTLNVSGSNVLTVNKINLAVLLKNEDAAEYNGRAQTVTAANVLSVDGTNPDGIVASGFTFTYAEVMLNVGDYTYGVEISDGNIRGNYNLTVTGGAYKIIPTEINVTLKNYEETYCNTDFTIDVNKAITEITGKHAALVTKADFVPEYVDELRYHGEYTYGVELSDAVKKGNFKVKTTGGNFKINKRKIELTLSNLEISAEDYKEGFDETATDFDVTYNISLSSGSSLANGDSFRVIKAYAEGLGNMAIALYRIENYELSNEDNYEFVNLDGVTPIMAEIVVVDKDYDKYL